MISSSSRLSEVEAIGYKGPFMPTISKNNFREKAQTFLSIAPQFRLGDLPTEQPHPLTGNLSELANHDLNKALGILHQVDSDALEVLAGNCAERIMLMAQRIKQTLDNGRSVFLCGCGATGRLSLACEALWHRHHKGESVDTRVIGFMAGGDAALVRSIEDFEDHPEYGARQLSELGFANGDLLISCTEGGETPFVIGATLCAAETSDNPPFFLYCNPDGILERIARRSSQVIRDSRIEKINCSVGPMALTGSTRMQASTVLMAAVGYALLWHEKPQKIRASLEALLRLWHGTDPGFLSRFIVREAEAYLHGARVDYLTDADCAVTILTDTTERAPTFSVLPFENFLDVDPKAQPSLCYLFLPVAVQSAAAWELILGRPPRALAWDNVKGIASYERLLGFDFSIHGRQIRQALSAAAPQHRCFSIMNQPGHLALDFDGDTHSLDTTGADQLGRHLLLKMLLNMHSTLVMGRLGRFEGNVMTWVRPSNNKLIDRTIRYADLLLKKKGIIATYEQLANACFELREIVGPDQSLVHALAGHFDKTG
jgi:N-acetylmuramic acid 6-phosphate etherase